MKKKYTAAGLLAVALVSCTMAYQFAMAEERAAQAWRPSQDSQLQSLDARLGEKVREFLELNELLSRQLEDVRLQQAGQQNSPLLTGNTFVPAPVEVAPHQVSSPSVAAESIASFSRSERHQSDESHPLIDSRSAESQSPLEPYQPAESNPFIEPRAAESQASLESDQLASPPARQAPWWSRYRLSMVVYSDSARSAVVNGRYVRRGDAVTSGVVVRDIRPNQVTLARGGETARLTIGAE